MDKLNKLRQKIDRIDEQILHLLNQRGKVVRAIGKIKSRLNESFYASYREKSILQRMNKLNSGPLSTESIENIFREIFHACRALEQILKVAYLGPEATFTHLAARKVFGSPANYLPLKDIRDVFMAVEKNHADFGVVPVENTTEGVVTHTLDMFIDSPLTISAEINLTIEQCLLSKSSDLKQITTVYSHPQAIAQCSHWLRENLPNARLIECSSTSAAALTAAKDRHAAAIASRLAASLYNLEIVRQGIEDNPENRTRFLVIGKNVNTRPSGYDKTSVMFSIKDRVGALHDMLVPFKKYNINLTKIESRPTKKRAWEYIFFLDFLGHMNNARIKKALSELSRNCVFLKILGSYPRAD